MLLLKLEVALFCFFLSHSLWLFRSNFSFAYTQVTSSFPFPSSLPLAAAGIPAGMSSWAFQSDNTLYWKTLKCFLLSFPASLLSKEVNSQVVKGMERSLLQS